MSRANAKAILSLLLISVYYREISITYAVKSMNFSAVKRHFLGHDFLLNWTFLEEHSGPV